RRTSSAGSAAAGSTRPRVRVRSSGGRSTTTKPPRSTTQSEPSSPSTSRGGAWSSGTEDRVSAQAQRRNQSVQKAAALLRAAAGAPEGVTVSELARRAGLPRATALRMVEALLAERFLRRLPDDRVALGAGLLGIARAADPGALLLEAAEAPLTALVASVSETITLTVSRPDGSLEIDRQLDGPHMLGPTYWVRRP